VLPYYPPHDQRAAWIKENAVGWMAASGGVRSSRGESKVNVMGGPTAREIS